MVRKADEPEVDDAEGDDEVVTKSNLKEMLREILPEFLGGDDNDVDDPTEPEVEDEGGALPSIRAIEAAAKKAVKEAIGELEAKRPKPKKKVTVAKETETEPDEPKKKSIFQVQWGK